jgi:hypothetical protein
VTSRFLIGWRAVKRGHKVKGGGIRRGRDVGCFLSLKEEKSIVEVELVSVESW